MKKFLIFLYLILSVSNISFAGWKIVEVNHSMDGDNEESIFYIEKGKFRVSMMHLEVIYDTEKQSMIYINTINKMYWKGNREEFKKEMEKYIEKTLVEAMGTEGYAEYKKNMETMKADSDNGGENEIKIVDEDEMITIAGRQAKKFTIYWNGELEQEVWLCKEINIYNEINTDVFKNLFDEESDETISFADNQEYLDLLTNNGYPLREIDYSYGEVMMNSEIKDIREVDLPSSTFEIPPGYQSGGLFEVMGQ